MDSFKIGDLTLTPEEQRTYLIMLEAIKACPMQKRLQELEHEVHGKDGSNGLKSKVDKIVGAVGILSLITVGVVLYIITLNIVY